VSIDNTQKSSSHQRIGLRTVHQTRFFCGYFFAPPQMADAISDVGSKVERLCGDKNIGPSDIHNLSIPLLDVHTYQTAKTLELRRLYDTG
jgi:hypothetical protein